MVFLMGYQVAQQEHRPTWNKDDFFDNKLGGKVPVQPTENDQQKTQPLRQTEH